MSASDRKAKAIYHANQNKELRNTIRVLTAINAEIEADRLETKIQLMAAWKRILELIEIIEQLKGKQCEK